MTTSTPLREHNFDGLVGPTHNFGGLSTGNVASTSSSGTSSNPRAAALEGLAKMKTVRELGVAQAVLPPHERPSLKTLHALGFRGSDEQVLAQAWSTEGGLLLRLSSSASSMWAANAATVAPSTDTADGRLHLTVANLRFMFHRALEAETTHRVLGRVFADEARFAVHGALPGGLDFADEGAANHTRLATEGHAAVHVFGWGRRALRGGGFGPQRYPARQTYEASEAVARLHQLASSRVILEQQHPEGIDAGSFHTDVLATGNERFFMLHDLAFVDPEHLVARLKSQLGDALFVVRASEAELPVADAVSAYPFNAQVLTLEDGSMEILAPAESHENPRARAFLEKITQLPGSPVRRVRSIDLRQSMRNGGGPACLRLRVPLTQAERAALGARVLLDDALEASLRAWIEKHYRDRLVSSDLADPALHRETLAALDELTQLLELGPVYDFQRARS